MAKKHIKDNELSEEVDLIHLKSLVKINKAEEASDLLKDAGIYNAIQMERKESFSFWKLKLKLWLR